MYRANLSPTPWFWNFLGSSLLVSSIGFSWSLFKSSSYKIAVASHQIEVNNEIQKVKDVIEESEEEVKKLPLDPDIKQKTLDKLEQSRENLEETSSVLENTQSELLDEE